MQDWDSATEALQFFPKRVAYGKEHRRAVGANRAKAYIVDAAVCVIRVNRDGVSRAVLDDDGCTRLGLRQPYARANRCAVHIGVNIGYLRSVTRRCSGCGRGRDTIAADRHGSQRVNTGS